MTGVAVVIPNWNSRDLLERCLDSLSAQPPAELVVADNGSRDDSLDILRRRNVDHVALPQNVGFARAVNLAAARTSSDFVLVLNVDTTVEPGAFEHLSKTLAGDPGLGGVQPRILQAGSHPTRIYSAGQRLLRDGRAIEIGAGEQDGPAFRVGREVFGVCGAACLLRRELFTDLGGYEERYFSFYEDVELNARAQLAGWRFRYVPEAVISHVGNAVWESAAPRPSAFNARLVGRNRLATDIKVMPGRSAPRILIAELGSVARSMRYGTLAATLSGKLAAARWLPRLLRERRQISPNQRARVIEPWLANDPWLSRSSLTPTTRRRRA